MITPRRAVIAIVTVVIIFFLHHVSQSSAGDVSGSGEKTQLRSYPPSIRKGQGQQKVLHDMASRPLRDRIKYYFPYDIESKFPAYIWQTWKASPSSGTFDALLRAKEASWSELHPGFVHEVIVDDAAEHLVSYLFASVPEIPEAYSAMPVPVLKADFFRYLILLARGGIYSDIDTRALKSAADWLPKDVDQSAVGLVVGIEADPDRDDWRDWYARRIQFCQWTIQSKPGHPVLREIVANITDTTLSLKRQGLLSEGRVPSAVSVMEFTGPGVWTDAVFSYFGSKDFLAANTDQHLRNVSLSDFYELKQHKKVGDVMVLPITSFSPGVGQMGSGDLDDPLAFVHHEFAGSWKSEKKKAKTTEDAFAMD